MKAKSFYGFLSRDTNILISKIRLMFSDSMNSLIQIHNKQLVVSSRKVAEHFDKGHRNVTACIRDILGAEKSTTKFSH